MSSYGGMLIDALILGFVLYALIHGTLATYITLARTAPSTGGVQPASASQIAAGTATAAAQQAGIQAMTP